MGDSKNILVTGGSGLIGTRLTELLRAQGFRVAHLGRSKKSNTFPSFTWDIKQQVIDPGAFQSVDTIVHLAGAGIADERWTNARKREILNSRVQSTRLLYNELKRQPNSIRSFISASAIGYYGSDQNDVARREDSPPGNDFLAEVTRQWEREVDRISELGIRVVKIRSGIVLSERGGALKEMATPVKYFVGAPLGSGNQFMSWIHIDDLCHIFIKAIKDVSIRGSYNAVTPHPVTNREMIRAIAKILHKPLLFPAVPGAVLKILLGEMSQIVLNGSKISADKILNTGYIFKFLNLDEALKDLLIGNRGK